MARIPIKKEVKNSRLLKDYASWIYCDNCNKTVAYLCYVTYDFFDFDYECECGNKGHIEIEFENQGSEDSNEELVIVKNRLCCPNDQAPLLTVIEKRLKQYRYEILCNKCHTKYIRSK